VANDKKKEIKEMAKKSSATKKNGPGRPQKYPLTAAQEAKVIRLLNDGISKNEISSRMNIHEFAVLRVRRSM